MSTSSMRKVGVIQLLEGVTTTATGEQKDLWNTNRTFEAYGNTSAGVGAATIIIEVRNSDNSDWHTMGTISLTLGTTISGDGFASAAAWKYVRARVSAISGTGATIFANAGTAPL